VLAAVIVVVLGTLGLATRGAPAAELGGPGGSALPQIGAAQAVERDDVGDPFIITVPHGVVGDPTARYVLYWTTDWRSNVPTAVSSDLVHWRRVADSLPVLPSWATRSATMTWGPSVLRVAGGYRLYFSTEEAASSLECLGTAFSTNATGPFLDSAATPLVCQRSLGGDIDPSVLREASGLVSLVWKNDGNSRGLPTDIWQQTLSSDGSTLLASPHPLLGVDRAWEHGIVEGPSMLAATAGGYWLFYAGGAWQSDTYDTGVAWCATVSGPCRETSNGPLLASRPGVVSPGGLETFVDDTGRLWASYSAFPSTPANLAAAMAEDRVLEIAPVLRH
jgi:beta-xylosidase